MPTDLAMLVYTSLLALTLALPGAVALILAKGLPFAAGNRDAPYQIAPWGDRGNRAHRNMIENLPVFAALVIVAHLTGKANEVTALAAVVFFWSRVAHAAVYITGIPYARTAAFAVSVGALLMITGEIL